MKRAALFAMLAPLVACSPISRQGALPSEAVSLARAVRNTSVCDARFSFMERSMKSGHLARYASYTRSRESRMAHTRMAV